MTKSSPTLLFDGVCNLCNRVVIFIIRKDKKAKIKFAPLQSPAGEFYLKKHNLSIDVIDSIVYMKEDRLLLKSSAVLHLFKDLGDGWSLIYGLIIMPKFLRDYLYDIIARRRYSIFGKTEKCMVPSPDLADRFI